MVGPFSGAVDYGQDFYRVPTDPVRDNKWGPGNYELAGTQSPAGTSGGRVLTENRYGSFNPFDETVRCSWVIGGNIGEYAIEIRDRQPGPAELHFLQRENAAATSASVANSPASACRMPSLICSICH